MHFTNCVRIILCGFVVGVTWFALCALSLSFLAQDFLAVVQEGGAHTRWGGGYFFGVDLMMGMWAMWLYSAIAPRYGEGPKAVVIAGLAFWVIKSLQSFKWMALGFAPGVVVLVPLATTLISIFVALGIGAWLYEKSTSGTPHQGSSEP